MIYPVTTRNMSEEERLAYIEKHPINVKPKERVIKPVKKGKKVIS